MSTATSGSTRRRPSTRALALLTGLVVPLSLAMTSRALITGNLRLAQLGGFGIDGNMHVDSGETYDWANAGGGGGPSTCGALAHPGSAGPMGPLGLVCVNDKPTGQSDNSLSGHEQDLSLQAVCGSVPNQKSDLSNFYVASQAVSGFTTGPAVHSLLYLGWTRVNTLGSADMDFEFNQKAQDPNLALATCPSGNGTTVAPNRTDGDLLVEYQFGGNSIDIKLTRWITDNSTEGSCATSQAAPCWGAEMDLTGNNTASGAINDSTTVGSYTCTTPGGKSAAGCVLNELSGGDLQPDTFGEAGIDLTEALTTRTCQTFGSAYLKSRSSAVFTDALKDYIAPVPVNITNCVTPRVTTQLSTASAPLGTAVTDTATVSSFLGPNPPGGTVAFNVYRGTGSGACTGAPVKTAPAGAGSDGTSGDALTAQSDGTAMASQTITSGTALSPGHYEVQAVYSGDGTNNLRSSSACGSEPLQITRAQPRVSTQSSTAVLTVGSQSPISDTATFSGLVSGVAPTGSVTFTLYSDAGCATPATYAPGDSPNSGNVTGSGAISGGAATFSTTWTPTTSPATTPTYYWGVSWPGDANYAPVPASGTVQCASSDPVNPAHEELTVQRATPSLATQIRLDDIATLSGGDNPGGTVTFALFDTSDCTGNLVAQFDNVAISGGRASTVGLTPTTGSTLVSSGTTYSWRVTYNGDGDNNPVTVGCTPASHETAAISYAP